MTIKAPYYTKEQIWEIADKFRDDNCLGQIKVDILEIIEINFGIDVIPVPHLASLGVDAFISSNFKCIYVDKNMYESDSLQNRLKFTLAHELAHLVLHRKFYENLEIETMDDYIRVQGEIPDKEYSLIEYHAYEFAGRLLVAPDPLSRKVRKSLKLVPKNITAIADKELLAQYLAVPIAKDFEVSEQVITKRILKENLI